jgi:glycosyltransferase involved in cell wall biosynthesis
MVLDVMMPFYGRRDKFEEAVLSVLAQTSTSWQLTVVDDMYPDTEPGNWFRGIDDPRLRFVRNERNLGVSGNFRRCLELATADHLVIMGCDDIMLPGFVAHAHFLLNQFPAVAVVQPGVEAIDDRSNLVRPLADRMKTLYRPRGRGARVLSGERLATSLSRADWAYFPSLIWNRALIQEVGFRADLEVALDLAALLELTARGHELVLDDSVVFRYRRHPASVSSAKAVNGSRFIEEREVLWRAASQFRDLGWYRAARTARRALSSRLNALTMLPKSLRRDAPSERQILIRHVLGMPFSAEAGSA